MKSLFARRARRAGITSAALVAITALSLAGGSAALFAGCGGEDTTVGRQVVLKTQVEPGESAAAPFTNALGWTITLKKAALSVGALYYFDGAPIFSVRAPTNTNPNTNTNTNTKDVRERVAAFLGVGVAFAHPGHYEPGSTKGQMLEPTSVDLLAGPADLPAGNGVSGIFRSGQFSYNAPPVGPAAGELGGRVVVLEGEAVKGDAKRAFRASADADEALDTYLEPKVAGCVFEEVDVQADGTVIVRIEPSVWLDQVEFEELPESSDGSPVEMAEGTVARKAFTRGLKKGSAYVFRFAADSAPNGP
jgi:hypothetical protein